MSNEKSFKHQLEELQDRCGQLEKDAEGKEDETSLLRIIKIREIRNKLIGVCGAIVDLPLSKVALLLKSSEKAIEHLEKNPQSAGAHESFREVKLFTDRE